MWSSIARDYYYYECLILLEFLFLCSCVYVCSYSGADFLACPASLSPCLNKWNWSGLSIYEPSGINFLTQWPFHSNIMRAVYSLMWLVLICSFLCVFFCGLLFDLFSLVFLRFVFSWPYGCQDVNTKALNWINVIMNVSTKFKFG
jgi:hypothetical protein